MKDGEPCSYPGCLSHISHPCEGCGRVGGTMKPIPEMNKDEIIRELCERLGIPWHKYNPLGSVHCHIECSCGKIFSGYDDHEKLQEHCDEENFDFYSDPTSLLVEMMKQKDWKYFLELELDGTYAGPNTNQQDIPLCWVVDKKGALALQSLDWMRMPRRINGNS